MSSEPCEGGCGHSDAEHEAFDDGYIVGSLGGSRVSPYAVLTLREAWEYGWDYGRWEYKDSADETVLTRD